MSFRQKDMSHCIAHSARNAKLTSKLMPLCTIKAAESPLTCVRAAL